MLNDLPNELPFAKLWTGGWCPLGYGNPAPLGGIEHDRDVRSALHALTLSPRWLGA